MNFYKFQKSNVLLFTGLMMLVAGLPVSLFLTSLSQFFIVGSFFIEGSPIEKIKRFRKNRLAVMLVLIWLLHLIGLIWTSDLQEGMKDLRIKLPLLILPMVLAGSKPLSSRQFFWVLAVFVGSVFAGSMVSMAVYGGLIQRELHSIREIFIFNVSHIRFALFICLSVFILLQAVYTSYKQKSYGSVIVSLILILWFLFFLVFIESITGIFILIIATILQLTFLGFRKSVKWQKLIVLSGFLIIALFVSKEINGILKEYNSRQDYEINTGDKTKAGNSYIFLTDEDLYENGFPIWVYVCDEELETEWNRVSDIQFDSLDLRGQPLRFTLIRFLTSKGLRKDAEGVQSLSKSEIISIEKGIANVNYQNLSNTRIRLMQIVWEFDQYFKGFNPSGHSVTQRFEFWKAAVGIIADNPLIGVGTGDMPEAYKAQYIKTNSKLKEKYRLRAHNQYLAIAVGLGIPALIYFVFFLFYSIISTANRKDYLFRMFWIIAMLSMLTEDTLETQSGATFFTFFFCLLLFSKPESGIEER